MTQHKWTISITVQAKVSFRGHTWKPSMDRLSCWGSCLPTNWDNSWIIIIPYDASRKVLTKRTILSTDQIWIISKSSSTHSLSPVLNNEYFSTVSESPSIKHSLLSQDASSDSRCKTQWGKKKMIKWMCVLKFNCNCWQFLILKKWRFQRVQTKP